MTSIELKFSQVCYVILMMEYTKYSDFNLSLSQHLSSIRRPLESLHFHRFLILCICSDTPSENTGLQQIPKVFTAFYFILWCHREYRIYTAQTGVLELTPLVLSRRYRGDNQNSKFKFRFSYKQVCTVVTKLWQFTYWLNTWWSNRGLLHFRKQFCNITFKK